MEPKPTDDSIQELLALLMEGRLDAAGQKALAAHFEAHPEAARESLELWLHDARSAYVLAGGKGTDEMLSDVMAKIRGEQEGSDVLLRGVMDRIRERRTTRRAVEPRQSVPWAALLGLAAALLVVIVIWSGSSSTPSIQPIAKPEPAPAPTPRTPE